MEPIVVTTVIDRPREEIFAYLSDIANHSEFSDHYLVDWHLTRVNSIGVGAGARYKMKMPRNRFAWGDMVIADLQPPFRILEHGRAGKYNRVRTLSTYTLQPAPGGGTRVQYSYETQPHMLSDRLMEIVGGRAWLKRKSQRALRRMRAILEHDRDRGKRVTYAVE